MPDEGDCPDGQSCQLVGGTYACTIGTPPSDASEIDVDAPPSHDAQVTSDASIDAPLRPITFVQQATTKPIAVTTTLDLPNPVESHDAIIICLNFPSATAATITDISDTLGNSYAVVVGPVTRTSNVHYVAAAFNAHPGTDTLSITLSAAPANDADLMALEYSGLALSNAFDVSANASGNGTAMASGTASTTAGHELILGYAEAASATAGTGFTEHSDQSGNIVEDFVAFTAGPYEATATTTGGNWTMILATFKGR
jgi:hypothetical protein